MKVRKNHHKTCLKYIFPYSTPGVPLDVEGEARKPTSLLEAWERGRPWALASLRHTEPLRTRTAMRASTSSPLKRTSSHGPGPPRRVALSHEEGSGGQLSRADRRGVVYILKSSSCWERMQETSKQAPGDPGLLSNVQLLGDKHPRAVPTEPSERTLTQARLLNEGQGVWVSMQSAHPVGTQRVGFLVRRAAARDDPTARGPSPHVALMVSALRPAVT